MKKDPWIAELFQSYQRPFHRFNGSGARNEGGLSVITAICVDRFVGFARRPEILAPLP